MALVVGDLVYMAVNGGRQTDPPLFGVVDVVNGEPPDIVRVNWENGAQQTFASATEAVNRLVAFTDGALTTSLAVRRVLVTAGGTLHLVFSAGSFRLVAI